MRYENVIFDLDGTILNTLEDLTDSLNFCLSQYGYPNRTQTEVRSFVGNGIRRLIERAVPELVKEETIQMIYEKFIPYYQQHCAVKTKPYEGIEELLTNLKNLGCMLAVVSNKADRAVQELCGVYFNGKFDYYVGERNGIRRKPAPDSVLEIIKYFNISAARTVYVGDSEVDIMTARNAGIDCISVDWGFCDADFLKQQGASRLVSYPKEILKICMDGLSAGV